MKNKPYRVIIAGSRSFNDYDLLCQKCDEIFSSVKQEKKIIIISGTAQGADCLGEKYAREHNIPVRRFAAQWQIYNKAAGIIRNAQMADNAEALIAFWDGQSAGTKNMIWTARNKGLDVTMVIYMTAEMKRHIKSLGDDFSNKKSRQELFYLINSYLKKNKS